jgi:hypothetical protein
MERSSPNRKKQKEGAMKKRKRFLPLSPPFILFIQKSKFIKKIKKKG